MATKCHIQKVETIQTPFALLLLLFEREQKNCSFPFFASLGVFQRPYLSKFLYFYDHGGVSQTILLISKRNIHTQDFISQIDMVSQKIEICIEMVKMAIEIVTMFVDTVGTIISKDNDNSSSTTQSNIDLPTPYVGFWRMDIFSIQFNFVWDRDVDAIVGIWEIKFWYSFEISIVNELKIQLLKLTKFNTCWFLRFVVIVLLIIQINSLYATLLWSWSI